MNSNVNTMHAAQSYNLTKRVLCCHNYLYNVYLKREDYADNCRNSLAMETTRPLTASSSDTVIPHSLMQHFDAARQTARAWLFCLNFDTTVVLILACMCLILIRAAGGLFDKLMRREGEQRRRHKTRSLTQCDRSFFG